MISAPVISVNKWIAYCSHINSEDGTLNEVHPPRSPVNHRSCAGQRPTS